MLGTIHLKYAYTYLITGTNGWQLTRSLLHDMASSKKNLFCTNLHSIRLFVSHIMLHTAQDHLMLLGLSSGASSAIVIGFMMLALTAPFLSLTLILYLSTSMLVSWIS